MGFLKFLGRSKEKTVDELDVPPPPPNSPDFGDMGKDFSTPLPGDEMSSQLSGIPYGAGKQRGFPPTDFPSFEDINLPEMPRRPEVRGIEDPLPQFGQQPLQQPMPLGEMQPLQEHPSIHTNALNPNNTYVRVMDYKQVMTGLTQIRSDLRKAGLGLAEMLNSIAERERDHNKYRNALMDMQKKFVFMDKTLFSREEAR